MKEEMHSDVLSVVYLSTAMDVPPFCESLLSISMVVQIPKLLDF